MDRRIAVGLSTILVLVAGCSPGSGATRVDVPRPTSADAAACDVALSTDESIQERAVALREIGLFADRSSLSDAELGQSIQREIEEMWGDQLAADEPLMDLLVAERDETRVWWHDLEADVVAENRVYVATLEEWAAISEGAFAPSDIVETWASDQGPITVAFTADGQAHEVQPAVIDDWIDPSIASKINELIAPTGRRFEFFQAFDQTAFVMALDANERAALEGRGWCFE